MRNHSLLAKSIGSFDLCIGLRAVAQEVPIVQPGSWPLADLIFTRFPMI